MTRATTSISQSASVPSAAWRLPARGEQDGAGRTSSDESEGRGKSRFHYQAPGRASLRVLGHAVRDNAMGVIVAEPPTLVWDIERELVSLNRLRELASMPATDTSSPPVALAAGDRLPMVVVVGIVSGLLVVSRRSRRT
jgi:hypothetical protein